MLGRRFEGGVELSGGEWQKVALARAYMRDAQVLILDEPTAALDARAEYEVFLRFSQLMAGRMAVIISHRFSTVRMADRIIVLSSTAPWSKTARTRSWWRRAVCMPHSSRCRQRGTGKPRCDMPPAVPWRCTQRSEVLSGSEQREWCMKPAQPHRVPALRLGYIFLRIGAAAFGGLGASLALIERELVTKRQWLTAAEVTEALTYTKLLPGSTGPQVVAYLGYKLGGWSGSAVATAAFLFPAALMMLVLAAAYVSVTAVPAMRPAITGLTAAIVGVLLATTYRLGKANIPDRITLGIALASIVAGAVLGISAAVIVVLAGLVGVCLYALPLRKQAAQEDTP